MEMKYGKISKRNLFTTKAIFVTYMYITCIHENLMMKIVFVDNCLQELILPTFRLDALLLFNEHCIHVQVTSQVYYVCFQLCTFLPTRDSSLAI